MSIGLLILIILATLIEIWWIVFGFKNINPGFIENLWMAIVGINIAIILALLAWGLYELITMSFWKIQIY